MKKEKIIVCDHLHQSGINILENSNEISFVDASDLNKTELLVAIQDATVAITRSSTTIDDEFLKNAKNMKAIVRAGVGVDNVDIDGCSKLGIIVMNIPTANTIAATELTMAHILSCMRKMPFAHNQLKNDKIWKREDWYGSELYGKKLGIIGFGNIGSRVGERAQAFGMDIVAFDPYIDPKKATDMDINYTNNFDDILACDIITIHTPKNNETIGMIGQKEINKMKDGVVLINCARGGLYDETALYDNLKCGKISIAGIDVFDKEPTTNSKLFDLNNIIVTAHLGANTIESQYNIATQAATNAMQALKGISYPHALNLPIDETKIPKFVKPYMELTQKIAFLISQLDKSQIRSIRLEAQGDIATYLDSLITFAIVGSLTNSSSNEKLNYVNAKFIAKEKNIELETIKQPNNSGYKNKITVKITTKNTKNKISGTVFDEDVHRIININNYEMDIEPAGKMLFVRNSDVPGVVGEVGKILGDKDINISDFRLGRHKDGALAVILVDNNIDEITVEEISSLKQAKTVCFVNI